MYNGKGVRLQSLGSQRFQTFWTKIEPSFNGRRLAIIGSECPQNFSCLKDNYICDFISNAKDCLRKAKSLGFEVSTSLSHYYDLIILELTKSQKTNLGLISLADEYIQNGGAMIVNGDNQIGVKSFLKKISDYWTEEITVIRKKGRIAFYKKKKHYLYHGKNI